MNFTLTPGSLTLKNIRQLLDTACTLTLDPKCHAAINASSKQVQEIVANNTTVYGINTGFGLLANTRIETKNLELLQQNIVLSHAAGTGNLLSEETVRLILALKINSLARGYSGVRLSIIEALITLFNARMYPCIPAQGSVGASGDLAPLAHMSAALLGVGNVTYQGKILSALDGLKLINLKPITLSAKEGLALLNGTQASTALALQAVLLAETLFSAALVTGALSTDATLSSTRPFDQRIQEVRGHANQTQVALLLRELLKDSELNPSHQTCEKVQDPYSLRCQPQVMGACLAHLRFAKETLIIEANAVSDNPLIFTETNTVLSGGNFHAEPVAMAADTMALSLAEIGALSERRLAVLIDPKFSQLPPFLVPDAGLNSGFMVAQVTAAALASENKSLAHPASVDSLPTSANQEDHVSMATYAARRLLSMIENTTGIIAIELLAACQGLEFRRPLKTSTTLEEAFALVRAQVAFYDKDRFFAPDIAAAKELVLSGKLSQLLTFEL